MCGSVSDRRSGRAEVDMWMAWVFDEGRRSSWRVMYRSNGIGTVTRLRYSIGSGLKPWIDSEKAKSHLHLHCGCYRVGLRLDDYLDCRLRRSERKVGDCSCRGGSIYRGNVSDREVIN
jgi:hypothetical protein